MAKSPTKTQSIVQLSKSESVYLSVKLSPKNYETNRVTIIFNEKDLLILLENSIGADRICNHPSVRPAFAAYCKIGRLANQIIYLTNLLTTGAETQPFDDRPAEKVSAPNIQEIRQFPFDIR